MNKDERRAYLMRMSNEEGNLFLNGKQVCSSFPVDAFRLSGDLQLSVQIQRHMRLQNDNQRLISRTETLERGGRHPNRPSDLAPADLAPVDLAPADPASADQLSGNQTPQGTAEDYPEAQEGFISSSSSLYEREVACRHMEMCMSASIVTLLNRYVCLSGNQIPDKPKSPIYAKDRPVNSVLQGVRNSLPAGTYPDILLLWPHMEVSRSVDQSHKIVSILQMRYLKPSPCRLEGRNVEGSPN